MAPLYAAREVEPRDVHRLVELFGETHTGCFCRYWHFEGDKNEWLERTAQRPEENKLELERELAIKSPEALGVVAESAEHGLVGWLKLTRASNVSKAYQQRYYRSLPCFTGDREGVHLVGCVLVGPGHRKRGVAHALVAGALVVAERHGATAVEAFPRRALERVADEELWMGPLSVFERLGFVAVHRSANAPPGQPDPYPVFRLEIPRRNA